MTFPPLFNPSNDMALASGLRQYSPPKRIQQMENDLAPLATLWEDMPFRGPWGWSLATKRRYRQMGIPEADLPGDEWLNEVRRLSSREFACDYLHHLIRPFENDKRLLGHGMRFHTEAQEPTGEAQIFKSPWSSSGRGVFTSANLTREQILTRLRGFISTQGGYVSDHFYAGKTLDFAMEFFVSEDHSVQFLGYSIFHTEANGTYAYNLVDGQDHLRSLIDYDDDLLSRLIDYHILHLGKTSYHGPVGIDMLLTSPEEDTMPNGILPKCKIVQSTNGKSSNGKYLHPVVEINFRMNMGILALLLYERYGAGATVQLTPERLHGFQAMVEGGRLMITYKP